MANYYIDENGEKQGPFDAEQLKELVRQGVISPNTQIETKSGHGIRASAIPMLFPGTTDIGFTWFVTPVLLVICWWFFVIATPIIALVLMGQLNWNHDEGGAFVQCLVLAGIAAVVLLGVRIILESVAVLFRIENHQKMARLLLDRFERMSKME